MNATFRQLQIFLALAEHGSVTAAARACHVTQPTVSMQLRELSDNTGLALYEQIGKRLFLTEAGRELARSAQAMVDEWAAFGQRVAAIKGLRQGRLKVAVVDTAKYFMPRLLADFCALHPDIDVSLQVLNRDGVLQRLHDNRDDLYIMSAPPTDIAIEQQVFLANPLVVIAPIRHRLARSGPLPLERLAGERFIMREAGSGTRLSCDAHFRSLGFAPLVRLELGSNEAIKQAVAGGMGLAVLSVHALGDHLVDEELTLLKVQEFPVHSNWYTVQLKGRRPSPVASAFLGYLERQVAPLRASVRALEKRARGRSRSLPQA